MSERSLTRREKEDGKVKTSHEAERKPTVLGRVAALLVLFAVCSPAAAWAQKGDRSAAATSDQFFIIASVDARKQQLVLKRPTEVTELMQITDKTACVDEDGKPIHFADLRAGDTVFVTSARGAGGATVALRIRKGPMTVEELRRRYLNSSSEP
jgi:hypothetical protein